MRKIKIAIVDDDEKSISDLVGLFNRYSQEEKVEFSIFTYTDSEVFLRSFTDDIDLLFLDIQMPKYSGMDIAEKIREKNRNVAIIFETEFGQYAIMGYRYDALDYFIKPISYYDLKMRMLMFFRNKNLINNSIPVKVRGGVKYLTYNSILYIEVDGHGLIFHTDEGEVVSTRRESLSKTEEAFKDFAFARCSSSFLVNLSRCSSIMDDKVKVGDTEIEISRGMRKEFAEKLSAYQRKDHA